MRDTAMGCSASVVCKPQADEENELLVGGENTLILDETEKRVISKTWRLVSKDMPSVGTKVFLQIFTIEPTVKKLFPFRDITGDALLRDTQFRGHAFRFIQAIGAAVDNIDDINSAMAPLLLRLGKQHVHYKDFDVDYFDIFIRAILHVLENELGSKYTVGVSIAWNHVVDFIISKLKEGYIGALQNKRTTAGNKKKI